MRAAPGLERGAARVCSPEDDGLARLSVRSGFDLLLEALALLVGSEVLVSAAAHPDMVRILKEHGLRAALRNEMEREPILRTESALYHLTHKYGVFKPPMGTYPQYVVDKRPGAVDKWNRCNKSLTLYNCIFAIRYK